MEILTICFFIGALALSLRGVRLVRWIHKHTMRKRHNLSERYGKGSWALVTGANAGIGFAFCTKLAKEGFGILLVSRNKERLVDAEKRLKTAVPGAKTHIIVADFSTMLKLEDYERTFAEITTK